MFAQCDRQNPKMHPDSVPCCARLAITPGTMNMMAFTPRQGNVPWLTVKQGDSPHGLTELHEPEQQSVFSEEEVRDLRQGRAGYTAAGAPGEGTGVLQELRAAPG